MILGARAAESQGNAETGGVTGRHDSLGHDLAARDTVTAVTPLCFSVFLAESKGEEQR